MVEALREVDLEVERGEFVVVMGPSGGGKSTLLNLIGGLDRPDSGTLEVAGVDVGRASQRELDDYRRRHVGFVFQFFNLISTVNAGDNVALALLARRTPWREARRLAGACSPSSGSATEWIIYLPSCPAASNNVAIARAVAGEPDLVLADEPTGDVDAATTVTVMALLSRLNRERGMTVIAVTHDPALLPYASRVLILRDGSFL